MPAYNNATPPLSLFPGDVGFSFNAESFPAGGTAGAQFAIPEPAGLPDQGHTVRWQTIFGTVLHQFFSAEAIQVPKESTLLGFPGVLFLSHSCTVTES